MNVIRKITSGIRKHFSEDRDHGGWINIDWPWNYWQSNLSVDAGLNNVVYACIQAYAQTIAQLPPNHLRRRKGGSYETLTDTQVTELLHAPNQYQTTSDLVLNMVGSLMSDGNSYALAQRSGRSFEITGIHLLPRRACHPIVTGDGDIFYNISPDDVVREDSRIAPARDILHVKLFTPDDPLRGVSPIKSAAMSAAMNSTIVSTQKAFFTNMSRPSGVLQTDQELTSEQTADLRQRWNEQSKQVNAGGVPILSWGLKWHSMGLNSEDAQLIQALDYSVKDIARAFRIPLPLLSEDKSDTYNNVFALIQMWKGAGLGFVMEHVEQAITRFLRLPSGEKIEFDADRLLRTDMVSRIKAITEGMRGGLYAINEARSMENLPPVDGGDIPMVQQQMVPINEDREEDLTLSADEIADNLQRRIRIPT